MKMFNPSKYGFKGNVIYKEPLSAHLTMRVGGPAALFCEPESENDLALLLRLLREEEVAVAIIGGGSNLLALDEGYEGCVIHIGSNLASFIIKGTSVNAGAGLSLSRLVSITAAQGLSGLEFAVGICGSLGGAVVMNAGTPQGNLGMLIRRARSVDLDGSRRVWEHGDLIFDYRYSSFQDSDVIITGAELELMEGDRAEIMKAIEHFRAGRKAAQPMGYPCAGSIFKNPPGDYAGRLLEMAELKGLRIGGAVVSEVHANFIINTGKATAADITFLMQEMSRRVCERFGIILEPEIRFIGG
ncbi:MAG: UDP-N-acetylmuramate dehydrogenase [bacterium]|nr:UDP-N-acetylmuramate dehydrogenase [bacterium]